MIEGGVCLENQIKDMSQEFVGIARNGRSLDNKGRRT